MNETARNPLESLLVRLRDTLADATPEPLANRIRPVLEGFFEQFQLVPKREYDAQLAALTRLEQTVADLEARIDQLERSD